MRPASFSPDDPVDAAELDRVVEGTRYVAALIAESLASLEPPVTVPQWRVLVLADAGACNVTGVAQDLGIHISNATRTCDRLVEAGLLERRRARHDRRHVLLALTPRGQQLFDSAMTYRRRRLEEAMLLMNPADRAELAHGLTRLVQAAVQVRDDSTTTPEGGGNVTTDSHAHDRHPPRSDRLRQAAPG